MRILFCIVFVFLAYFISAQNTYCYHPDAGKFPREKNISLNSLSLDIKLLEKQGRVDGKATYTMSYLRKEVDTLFLDAIEFQVKSITINGEVMRYRADSAGITIYLPKDKKDSSTLVIDYTAYPVRGMYFLNWNNPDPKAYRQIWTQGQGIDNRHWIPGLDDVANLVDYHVRITFNDQYPLVSNGNLLSVVQNVDHTKTWEYKLYNKHALYLVMIAAGDYKMKTQKSKNGVQLDQYYYPDRAYCFEATYQHSEVMMDWFEQEIGVPYPWNGIYRNVPTKDFLYGAMENTSSTIFTDNMHVDSRAQLERPYLNVNAHELAHQWFGDLITERAGAHHWLHESFATHYSKRFIKWLKGDLEFDASRMGELNAAFAAGQNNSLPIGHSGSGSPRHYPKGSFVLDMLRNELGNENYRRSITHYLTKHGHQNVVTSDLIDAIYETTGRSVDWFFDQWIYRGGEPVIEVDFSIRKNQLELTTTQTHKMEATVKAFRLPMQLSVYYKSGRKELFSVLLHNEKDIFQIHLNDKEVFDFLVLDEDVNFLRRISYRKGEVLDRQILEKSTYHLARLEAATRLKEFVWKGKKELYASVFHRESSYLVRREILDQLMYKEEDETMQDILSHGLRDEHFLVRRAAIQAIHISNPVLKSLLVQALNDSSYVNIEHAFNKLWTLYSDESDHTNWLNMLHTLGGTSRNNLSILYNSKLLAQSQDKIHSEAFQSLKYLASESADFRARIPAIEALMSSKAIDSELVSHLIQGALYFHPGIRNTSIENLKKIQKDFPDIFQAAVDNYPYQVPRKTKEILMKRIQ